MQKEEAMNSRPLVFLQSLVAAAALLTASFSASVSENMPALNIKGNVTEDVGTKKILVVIPNAKVYLKQPLNQIYTTQSVAPPIIISYRIIDSTSTGNTGEFSFSNVAQGSYTLGFVADNYQSLDVSLNAMADATLSVKLLPLNAYCTITGTVYEATPPGVIGCAPSPVGCVVGTVAACTVSINRPIVLPLAQEAASAPFFSYGYKAVTNSQGAYTIDSVPVAYDNRNAPVVAKKNGFALETKQALLQPQEAVSVYFALQKAYANISTKTVDNISFTIATDKAVYNKYEAINVRYTIKNNSMAAVTYTLGGCKYDMVAREPNGDTAYWYLKNYACLAIITYMTLSPGDSIFMNFPAFSYSDTAHSLTITARMNEAAYNQSAISVNVSIVQTMTPALLPNGNNERTQKGPMMTYSRSSKALYLNVDRPQLISVEAYTLSGRKIQEVLRKRFFTVGEHAISLDERGLANGIVIFRVVGQGWNETLRVTNASCR